ncbi:chemotaxis protein [Natronococcus pandeyae]|uniref:Chemotaxis protein n=2 Tax=Natronococcus pandeyae TaxID=2055836 RepID=A0A8J8Q4Z3_9EURY|nr:chemotaxis protein [Natronococcus pandeyae]
MIPRVIRRSYALKFVLVLLLLGLSIGAIGYAGTELVAGEVQSQVHDDQKQLAAQEANNIDQWNERNQFFAGDVATGIAGSSEEGAYLEQRKDGEDGVHDIHHVDLSTGAIAHSTNEDLAGEPITDADETWAAVDMEAVERADADISEDPLIGTVQDGTPVLFYVESVDEDGTELTVLAIDVYDYVDEMITSDGTATYAVYTGDPGPVIDDDRTESDEPMVKDEPVINMDTSGEAFYDVYETDIDFDEVDQTPSIYDAGTPRAALEQSVDEAYHDEEFLATTAQITEDSNFYVVVHTPESEAYGIVDDVSAWGIYASIGGIVLVMAVGGVMGRNTSRSIDRLTSKAERMESGELDVDFETDRIDSIGRLYDGFGSMRDSLEQQIRTAHEAREDAERARKETEQINEHLESTVEDYREVMRGCADGDLTARMDPESENEALTELATEFNEMIAEIEAATSQATAFANEVATASEEVTASSEEVRAASEQVTESVQEIADGADRQHERFQAVTHEMDGLSTTTEQIAASSSQVATYAQRTVETSRRGQQAAQEAIEGMNEIEAESDQAVTEIERLEAEMGQIDELLEFISEVAEQTNMLALNANIEASRSSSADDGFAVVADEVKELANETKLAAERIEERLDRIQDQTERTAAEVQRTSSRVAEHTDSIEDAADALDEITDYAEETNEGVQEISAATEEQAASTQEVVAMVDEAASISATTTAETDTAAAAAEEQTAAITDVSTSANDLAGQATQLSVMLDRFQTAPDAESDSPANESPLSSEPHEETAGSNDYTPEGDDYTLDGGDHTPDETETGADTDAGDVFTFTDE